MMLHGEIKENSVFVEGILKRFLWVLKSRNLEVAIVPILNILKQGDIISRLDESERQRLFEWIFLFSKQGKEASKNFGSRENIRILKGHFNENPRLKDETNASCLLRLFKNKAVAFAHAVAIMNNPRLVYEVGVFINEMDVNKSYMMSDKELTRKLKGRFPNVWLPQLP